MYDKVWKKLCINPRLDIFRDKIHLRFLKCSVGVYFLLILLYNIISDM